MNVKIRLVFGQKIEAPFANSAVVCVVMAMLAAAGSGLLWRDATDVLFLSREGARTQDVTVVSVNLIEEGYSPRAEIQGGEGESFSLMKSSAGEAYETLIRSIQPGDTLTLRFGRRGSVLEVERDGETLIPFSQVVSQAMLGAVLTALAAALFTVLAACLLLRALVLAMNRKAHPRAAG